MYMNNNENFNESDYLEGLSNANFTDEFRQGVYNTFNIITGKRTSNEIVLERGSDFTFFFMAPDEIPTLEDIEEIMGYLTDYEEYEMCGELNLLYKELKNRGDGK